MKNVSHPQMTDYELQSVDKFAEACHQGKWSSKGLTEILKLVSMYGNMTTLNRYCKNTKECYNTIKKEAIEIDGVKFIIKNE
jgi:hypothetical protein